MRKINERIFLPTIVLTLMLILVCTTVLLYLVGKTQTKILKVGSRHTVYLEKSFVEDTNFPFKPAEPLVAKIEKNRVILERA
jgi:hypothetical protein